MPQHDSEKQSRPPLHPESEERCLLSHSCRHARRVISVVLATLATIFLAYKALTGFMDFNYGSYQDITYGVFEVCKSSLCLSYPDRRAFQSSTESGGGSAIEYPMPPDIDIKYCTDWSPNPEFDFEALHDQLEDRPRSSSFTRVRESHSSRASFDLPLSSDTLFFLSRGATAGAINIVQSPALGDQKADVARVVVVAKYWRPSALDDVRVCSITRQQGEVGVGIFVSFVSPDPLNVKPEHDVGPTLVEAITGPLQYDGAPPRGRKRRETVTSE